MGELNMKRIYLLTVISAVVFLACLNAHGQAEELNQGTPAENSWQENVVGLKVYVNALVEENKQLRTANEELGRRVEDLNTSLKSSLEKCSSQAAPKPEMQSLKTENETLKKDKTDLQGKLESCKKEKAPKAAPCPDDKSKKFQDLLKACDQEKTKINKQLSVAEEKSKQQQKEIAQLKKAEEDLKKELSTQKNTYQKKSDQQLNAEKAKLTDQIDALKKEKIATQKEKEISDSLLKLQPRVSVISVPAAVTVADTNKASYELSGYNLAKSGQYDEAIIEYTKALQLNPQGKDIYFNLGFIYDKLKQYTAAVSNYEKVLSIDPNDKEALYNLSKVYEKLPDPAKAKYYYDLYLKQSK